MEEKYLPRISKAALNTYQAIMYVHERLDINKAKVNDGDISRLMAAFEKAGLYNIFLGAFLVKEAHLTHSVTNSTSSAIHTHTTGRNTHTNKDSISGITKTREAYAFTTRLNPIIERIAREKIMSKLSRAKISASSTDE